MDFLTSTNCIELADCCLCGAKQWERCRKVSSKGNATHVHQARRAQAYREATKLRELRGFIEAVESLEVAG